MNFAQVVRLQKEAGVYDLQELINSGQAWHMEGSVGRNAMHAIKIGLCMLPKKSFTDYYGNRIPARQELKPGTKGTWLFCKRAWGG